MVNIIFNQLYYKPHYMRNKMENIDLANVTIAIGMVTQAFFTLLEMIEIYYDGFGIYITSIYNIM